MTFSSGVQSTQVGQAIRVNAMSLNSLSQLYEGCIGPYGMLKVLVTPSGSMKITKDGSVIGKEVQFSHPTVMVLNKFARSLYTEVGDGTSSFIVLACKIFGNSYKYYLDGCSIRSLLGSLEEAKTAFVELLDKEKVRLDFSTDKAWEVMEKMAYYCLSTKVDKKMGKKLSSILVSSLRDLMSGNESTLDTNMVEIMKIKDGNSDVELVNGLVLDHGGRYSSMPRLLEDVAILATNMSLEYEKPEINSTFYYKASDERDELFRSERMHITERAKAIKEFAKKLRSDTGKNLVVISERGIDPFSLEILASENILALRRAKRRNMERLYKMCGCKLVTRLDQLRVDNLGYCKKVWIKKLGDESFTFVEGTPQKQSCTVLIKGDNQNDQERIQMAIKATLKSLSRAICEGVYVHGGPAFFFRLAKNMREKGREVNDGVGFKVLSDSFIDMTKILVRNLGQNVGVSLEALENGSYSSEDVIDNIAVVAPMIINSIVASINILLVDDIIKAGKPVKEEKTGNK